MLCLHPGQDTPEPEQSRGIVPLGMGEDRVDGELTRLVDGVDSPVPQIPGQSKAELFDLVPSEGLGPVEHAAIQAVQARRPTPPPAAERLISASLA